MPKVTDIFDEKKLEQILESTKNPTQKIILDILEKAEKKKGLTVKEVSYLLNAPDKYLNKIFETAGKIKDEIYGERLVLFAPLYVSSFCVNDCEYCGFHRRNKSKRKKLTLKEVKDQVQILEEMGHKRLLLEFGEDPKNNPIDYVVDVIKEIYKIKCKNGEIRRANVNIAATTVENYKELKNAGIGTYQLFQETYHKSSYEKLHNGPKANYERQLFAHNRAFEAGIDDVGLGVLFGLYDYKFEVLALLSHAQYLEKKFGVGPHTFSVPRFQPADSVTFDSPYKVSEDELLKIIAILRLAVPYTGMIISTRENAKTRAKAFKIGISQTSAGSRTAPGGYGHKKILEQFTLSDERDVPEIIESILKQGLLPSFCTACYRKGRTGEKFMEIAKPGNIHNLCRPNAILTFKEYLEDYANPKIKKLGQKVLEKYFELIENPETKKETAKRLILIEQGKRDLYF